MIRVAVAFCGGCKPEIDRQQLFRKLQELLPDYSFEFGVDEAKPPDCMLLINGCPTECRAKNIARQPNCISVRGEMIGNNRVAEDELPRTLASVIRSCTRADAQEMVRADLSEQGDGAL
jgi:hypothetical protein